MSEPLVEFRVATTTDAAMIRELVRSAYAKWVPLIGREPRPMTADYEQAIREHRIALVQIGGRMVGLVEMTLQADHMWIENICVRPDEQGKGIGRLLLRHAECCAREADRTEIRLLTNAAFETNIALYRKAGYVIVAREPFMGGMTVYMNKALEG